jgi:hypothetical protein
MKKKKDFDKSKYNVVEIPIKKKKPQVIDIDNFVETKSEVLPKKK